MSDYKGHTTFNLLLALPLLLGGAYYFSEPNPYLLATLGGAFVYSTLFMSPDLDLAYQIRLFSLRGFFSLPFRSYAKLFSHRGLSHNVLFGSLTRILWLLGWATLIFAAVYQALPTQQTFLTFYYSHEPYILYGLAGVCCADWAHLFLDKFGKK